LIDPLTEHATVRALLPEADPQQAAEYLLAELSIPVKTEPEGFPIPTPSQSQAAHDLLAEFKQTLTGKRLVKPLDAALQKLPTGVDQFQLLHDWLTTTSPEEELAEPAIHHLLIALHGARPTTIATALSTDLEGLLGSHPSISNDKTLPFSLPTFLEKLRRFEECDVPRYRDYHHLKTDILETKREDMRLEEFKPKVMSAFVRNKLLNDVFLPLIGDNLAKQLGTAGDSTRTDRMGMLLLISPPGYGKTTLMEYVANRLGVTFMKINGPAIGHEVTSLDPGDAPNLGAREEIEKLNLALEMGDNVLLYLDDIQHCNPEFLQKFISLCDAQRKIEGVYKGRARTYDLRVGDLEASTGLGVRVSCHDDGDLFAPTCWPTAPIPTTSATSSVATPMPSKARTSRTPSLRTPFSSASRPDRRRTSTPSCAWLKPARRKAST